MDHDEKAPGFLLSTPCFISMYRSKTAGLEKGERTGKGERRLLVEKNQDCKESPQYFWGRFFVDGPTEGRSDGKGSGFQKHKTRLFKSFSFLCEKY